MDSTGNQRFESLLRGAHLKRYGPNYLQHLTSPSLFLAQATQGDSDAQLSLADAYLTQKDFSSAFLWYQRAADKGHPHAQFHLGVCYSFGLGVSQSRDLAHTWLLRAADQGCDMAQNHLGYTCECMATLKNSPERKSAVAWYQKAAEQGLARAQYNLGLSYWKGHGVEKNDGQAVHWWIKAAGQGHEKAMYQLGLVYGQRNQWQDALILFRKSADQGCVSAQRMLGDIYRSDEKGVERDDAVAVGWYLKAAKQGDKQSCFKLGRCSERGIGVQQNWKKAVRWFRRSGSKLAMSCCYRKGVDAGLKEAILYQMQEPGRRTILRAKKRRKLKAS